MASTFPSTFPSAFNPNVAVPAFNGFTPLNGTGFSGFTGLNAFNGFPGTGFPGYFQNSFSSGVPFAGLPFVQGFPGVQNGWQNTWNWTPAQTGFQNQFPTGFQGQFQNQFQNPGVWNNFNTTTPWNTTFWNNTPWNNNSYNTVPSVFSQGFTGFQPNAFNGLNNGFVNGFTNGFVGNGNVYGSTPITQANPFQSFHQTWNQPWAPNNFANGFGQVYGGYNAFPGTTGFQNTVNNGFAPFFNGQGYNGLGFNTFGFNGFVPGAVPFQNYGQYPNQSVAANHGQSIPGNNTSSNGTYANAIKDANFGIAANAA